MINKEMIIKWIEALRSGKYKQGRDLLRKDDEYCCLGVACDIFKSDINGDWVKPVMGGRMSFKAGLIDVLYDIPPILKDKLGLPDKVRNHMVSMNDSFDKNFNEIADYLEKASNE